ncbi:MAG: PASTA domain-containing protein [Prevotellaceae bacterium]|jgi:beta-lactam-binding protein with PASTA domain|nr:PASTA domain-containing protein [Prevotellaceae bacterium]
MTFKEFFSLSKNRFFWVNVLAMAAVVVLLPLGVLKWLDNYTRHGQAVVVPAVKGLSVSAAERQFANRGLTCVVADSNYVKSLPAGCILDYTPSEGQKVKEGRVIYLTINTLNVPLQAVPKLTENSSMRQAQARLLALGFKLNENELIPGEKEWVYGVKYRDQLLAEDEQVPVGATLTLVIGDGQALPQPVDSLAVDSLKPATPSAPTGDSWF